MLGIEKMAHNPLRFRSGCVNSTQAETNDGGARQGEQTRRTPPEILYGRPEFLRGRTSGSVTGMRLRGDDARAFFKCYVYLLVDPHTGRPFYVGKGTGGRIESHLRGKGGSEKARKILGLMRNRQPPILEILRFGLSPKEAFEVEAAAIDLLEKQNLLNRVRGHHSDRGRKRLEEIVATQNAEEATILEPTILINIAKNFQYGLSPLELYDYTRSAWTVSRKFMSRERSPQYAFAVYQKIIREVYRIGTWLRSGSTMRIPHRRPAGSGRMEFVGKIAETSVRRRYLGKSVAKYLKKGSRNPIRYVNCG
jgi:hypothetical protein